jgi:hypothetical protein
MIELQKSRQLDVEMLEVRIAPAHVSLPAVPGHADGPVAAPEHNPHGTLPGLGGPSAAPDQNPHFSGRLRPPAFFGMGAD